MKLASLETLSCDAGWRPWLFVKATTDDGLAPVPARRAVFASPALARNGTLVVSCAGREELSLFSVLDAPPPR